MNPRLVLAPASAFGREPMRVSQSIVDNKDYRLGGNRNGCQLIDDYGFGVGGGEGGTDAGGVAGNFENSPVRGIARRGSAGTFEPRDLPELTLRATRPRRGREGGA